MRDAYIQKTGLAGWKNPQKHSNFAQKDFSEYENPLLVKPAIVLADNKRL